MESAATQIRNDTACSVSIRVVLRRLYLITWHVGLFVVLTLGQIGVQVRVLPRLDRLL